MEKRIMKTLFCSLVAALALTACGVDITTVGLAEKLSLTKGASSQLAIEYGAEDSATEEAIAKAAEKLTLVWSSSDEAVATVDENGNVTAVGAGTADITVALGEGNISSTCTVTVEVPAEGVSAPDTLALEVNGTNTAQLEAKAMPADATNVTFTYESSNPEVATVDENGVVTAVANGEADIIVAMKQDIAQSISDAAPASASERANESTETADGAKPGASTNAQAVTATTHMVVTTRVESLNLEKTEGVLTIGNTTTIKATVFPETASDQTIGWTSSDESIATVDADGKVKAVKVGTATITASIGDVTAEYALTVRDITCAYCGKTGHTSGSCPVEAADEQAAAAAAAAAAQQQATQNGGGTAAPSAPSGAAPAPNPQPSGGSSGGGTWEVIPGGNEVVTGGGNGEGSGQNGVIIF